MRSETLRDFFTQAGRGLSRLALLGRYVGGLGRLESKDLEDLDPAERDRVLHDCGLSSGQAGSLGPADPEKARLQSLMMEHYDVDPKSVPQAYWGALRDAGRVCAHCGNIRRCRHWLTEEARGGAHKDAPRVFCPNAALFDELADAAKPQQDGTAGAR